VTEVVENVVIIGQGYVGLPVAREATAAGFRVTGLDTDPHVAATLMAGRSHIADVPDDDITAMLAQGYVATVDDTVLADADVVVICVPTPLGDDGSPDLSAVEAATAATARQLKPGALVVLESTTYPGTTERVVLPALAHGGRVLDVDFALAFSPERIDPGNPTWGLRNTPKVVGGVSPASTDRACAFYARFVDTVVPVHGAMEAEMAKLLENTYRHVNIALVNEMAMFCQELGVDLWEAIRAAATKPFGYQPFYPGPGVGGHCIPIDPKLLGFEVHRRLGYPFRFVELAGEINRSMPRYVVDRVQDLLNEDAMALRGARILLLGISYKADVADRRESPADPIARALREKGAEVLFDDPRIPAWDLDGAELVRVPSLDDAVASADAVILLQAHREYEVDRLAGLARRFLDTRGVVSSRSVPRL
jgi:UDP-N-acetyl-D-glucosamine dehydrogenase